MDFAFPVLQQPTTAAEPTLLPQSPTPATSTASASAADAAPPSGSSQQRPPLTAFSTVTHASTSAAAEPRQPLTALSTTTHAAAPGSSPAPRLPLTAFSTVTHATSVAAEPVSAPASTSSSGSVAPAAAAAAGAGKGTGFDKGARSQVEYLRSQHGPLGAAPAPSVPLRPISLQELSQHKAVGDAWIALKGRVYDVTRYVQYHPGGARVLLKAAGTDATQVFAKFHPWVDAHYILAASQLGTLVAQGEEGVEAGPGEEAGQGKGAVGR